MQILKNLNLDFNKLPSIATQLVFNPQLNNRASFHHSRLPIDTSNSDTITYNVRYDYPKDDVLTFT